MSAGEIGRKSGPQAPHSWNACAESARLLDAFGRAVQELMRFHEQQFQAIIAGDSDANRFDLLIHEANEKKQAAKYAYMTHVENHGCAGI
jgi:hypothetical protein